MRGMKLYICLVCIILIGCSMSTTPPKDTSEKPLDKLAEENAILESPEKRDTTHAT